MSRIYSTLIALAGLTATALVVAESHSTPARSGEVVFDAHCANCHTGGIGGFFSGAPDVDDSDDWEELTPKGLDALTTRTISGIGDMVARGACAKCTDEELRAAVKHMLDEVE